MWVNIPYMDGMGFKFKYQVLPSDPNLVVLFLAFLRIEFFLHSGGLVQVTTGNSWYIGISTRTPLKTNGWIPKMMGLGKCISF